MARQDSGLKAANRALKQLPEFARAEAQKTMDATAFQIARMAAARAPRDTGTLADSISWQQRARSLSAVVLINVRKAFYWKFQEYGTVHHGAHPFLRPAAIQMAPSHDMRLRQALGKALHQVEQEAARG